MDLKELASGVDPNKHWYYQTKKIPLFKYFEKISNNNTARLDIIDIGAGSGFFSISLYKKYSDKINKVFLVDIGYTDQEIHETRDSNIIKTRIGSYAGSK